MEDQQETATVVPQTTITAEAVHIDGVVITLPPLASTETGQAAPIASPLDPGPPPSFPAAPGTHPVVEQVIGVVHAHGFNFDGAKEGILAISTMHLSPVISRYKAEVLAWLEARKAHFLNHGR